MAMHLPQGLRSRRIWEAYRVHFLRKTLLTVFPWQTTCSLQVNFDLSFLGQSTLVGYEEGPRNVHV